MKKEFIIEKSQHGTTQYLVSVGKNISWVNNIMEADRFDSEEECETVLKYNVSVEGKAVFQVKPCFIKN